MMAWTGFGWIAYAMIVGLFIGTMKLLDAGLGEGFSREHPVVLSTCSWIAVSVLCWPIGRYFNRELPLRVFDADWARKGRTRAHSTFFVRLEFAGLIVSLPFHLLVAIGGLEWLEG